MRVETPGQVHGGLEAGLVADVVGHVQKDGLVSHL